MSCRGLRFSMCAVAAAVALCGCAVGKGVVAAPVISRLAVMPILAVRPSGELRREEEVPVLPPDAGLAVTAQIYKVLASRSEFRVVPDLTVRDALDRTTGGDASGPAARAVAVGKEVGADGVLFGSVSRFRERVGGELGSKRRASVAFDLSLADVRSGKVVWNGRFRQTQQPLSENLLNFWMFWRAGPRWWSARELTQLGVERLLEDMRGRVIP